MTFDAIFLSPRGVETVHAPCGAADELRGADNPLASSAVRASRLEAHWERVVDSDRRIRLVCRWKSPSAENSWSEDLRGETREYHFDQLVA
jgi:hypothetical protein